MGCSRTGMPIHWWMSIQFLHINTTLMLVPCTSESLGLDHCRDQTLTDKRTSPMNFFFHYVWSHGFVGGTYLTFCYFNNATTPILDWMRTTQYSFLSTLQIYLSLGSSIRRVSTFAVISLWSWFSQSFKYNYFISWVNLLLTDLIQPPAAGCRCACCPACEPQSISCEVSSSTSKCCRAPR